MGSLGRVTRQHMQYTRAHTAARKARPPTTPPTIAPVEELESEVEALEVAVEAETEVKVRPGYEGKAEAKALFAEERKPGAATAAINELAEAASGVATVAVADRVMVPCSMRM